MLGYFADVREASRTMRTAIQFFWRSKSLWYTKPLIAQASPAL